MVSFLEFPGDILYGKFLCMKFLEVFGYNNYKEMREAELDRGRGSSVRCYNRDPRLSWKLLTKMGPQSCPKLRQGSCPLHPTFTNH